MTDVDKFLSPWAQTEIIYEEEGEETEMQME